MVSINRKRIQYIVFFCLFFFISVERSYSEPTILSVSLSGNGLESVTLGDSFGLKSTSGPVLFEQFEDNVNVSDPLGAKGIWIQEPGTDTTYSTTYQRTPNSTFNIKSKHIYGGTNAPFEKNVFGSPASPRKIFISFWSYIDVINFDANGSWQLKFWRLDAGADHGSYPQLAYEHWFKTDLSTHQTYLSLDGMSGTPIWDLGYNVDEWVYTQLIIQESSGVDVADGSITLKILHNGSAIREGVKKNIATRTTAYPNLLNWLHFGYYITNNLNKGHEVHTYWDDIYVDDTWARIAIGNKSFYSNCTHLEQQRITSWNKDRINFITNYGSFQEGDTAFLYVIDSDGNVSNKGNGVQIKISGSSAPPAPINLLIE